MPYELVGSSPPEVEDAIVGLILRLSNRVIESHCLLTLVILADLSFVALSMTDRLFGVAVFSATKCCVIDGWIPSFS